MDSQTVVAEIAQYRANHNGEIPAAVIIDGNNVECIDYATILARSEFSEVEDPDRLYDEYKVFIINYSIPGFYENNFPVLVDKYTKTNIRDYLFNLIEFETRP